MHLSIATTQARARMRRVSHGEAADWASVLVRSGLSVDFCQHRPQWEVADRIDESATCHRLKLSSTKWQHV
jgi:hypothetical protein